MNLPSLYAPPINPPAYAALDANTTWVYVPRQNGQMIPVNLPASSLPTFSSSTVPQVSFWGGGGGGLGGGVVPNLPIGWNPLQQEQLQQKDKHSLLVVVVILVGAQVAPQVVVVLVGAQVAPRVVVVLVGA